MCSEEKAMCRPREKMAMCKPRRDASEETKPANTLILDIQSPELHKINFYCLSSSVWRLPLRHVCNHPHPHPRPAQRLKYLLAWQANNSSIRLTYLCHSPQGVSSWTPNSNCTPGSLEIWGSMTSLFSFCFASCQKYTLRVIHHLDYLLLFLSPSCAIFFKET